MKHLSLIKKSNPYHLWYDFHNKPAFPIISDSLYTPRLVGSFTPLTLLGTNNSHINALLAGNIRDIRNSSSFTWPVSYSQR